MTFFNAFTVSSGYLPFAVSSDSITTSAPWITAFATSLTSARVGSGLSTIDPIVWVATMQIFACSRQNATNLRCTIGTISAPASTAISPRATITASEAFTISSRFLSLSTAFLVSILAIIFALESWSRKIWRSLWISSAHWINESAT